MKLLLIWLMSLLVAVNAGFDLDQENDELSNYVSLNLKSYANVARKSQTNAGRIYYNTLADDPRRIRTLCLTQHILNSISRAMAPQHRTLLQPVLDDYYAKFDRELNDFISVLLFDDKVSIDFIDKLTSGQTVNMDVLDQFKRLFINNNVTGSKDLCAFQKSLMTLLTDNSKFYVLTTTSKYTTLQQTTSPSGDSSSTTATTTEAPLEEDDDYTKEFKRNRMRYLEYLMETLAMLTDDVFKTVLNSQTNANLLTRLVKQQSACESIKRIVEFATSSYDVDCTDSDWSFDMCKLQSKLNRFIQPMLDIYLFHSTNSSSSSASGYEKYLRQYRMMNSFLVEFYKSYWSMLSDALKVRGENATELYDSYQTLLKSYPSELITSIQWDLMQANATNLCSIYANTSSRLNDVDNLLALNTFAKHFFTFLTSNADKAYELVAARNSTLIADIYATAAASAKADEESLKNDRLIKFCCSFKVIAVKYLSITLIPDSFCSNSCDLSKFQ